MQKQDQITDFTTSTFLIQNDLKAKTMYKIFNLKSH